jgi:DNA-binding CsgD family transcriptional regulator
VARTTEPAFEELRQTEERSVETIKAHMRNLFRKLDVSSRVEVARTM